MNSLLGNINTQIGRAEAQVHHDEYEVEEVFKETGQYVLFGGVLGTLIIMPFINSMVQKIPEAIMLASKFIP